MMNEEQRILDFYHQWSGHKPARINLLPESGSYRKYYRLEGHQGSVIGVYNDDRKENEAFLSFCHGFLKHGLPVPVVHAVDLTGKVYLLSDLGNESLFRYLTGIRRNDHDFPDKALQTYKKVINLLPVFQVIAGKQLDYSKCYPRQTFDHQSMMWDLNYFKYYFLKLAKIAFDEQALEDDFLVLVHFLEGAGADYFMYRDFQSRNIMLVNGEPWFIDFQGGRKGPLQYDIASLLYDAKASIPDRFRSQLLEYYLDTLDTYLPVNRKSFRQFYSGFVMIRILQALGTYGFRGYYENKPHFLKSIPYAITNLRNLLQSDAISLPLPMLREVLENIVEQPSFRPEEGRASQLIVKVISFSYRNGIPEDRSGNGGGFIFDCRALPNPGRYEEYRSFTGNDLQVKNFLEREQEVTDFLNHAFYLVDHSVRTYDERGFTHLVVGFGCTGGQHRSVYCANEMANHVRAKFHVTVDLHHLELKK